MVDTETVVITEPMRRPSSAASDAERDSEDGSDPVAEGGSRQRRSALARQKAKEHKAKAKAGTRSGTTRTAKQNATPPRVLPLPQLSERQQRARAAAMGQPVPEPLNLAPDPYDSSR